MITRAEHPTERRRRLTQRMLPMGALAFVAFVGGAVTGAGHVTGEQRVVERFAGAWRHGDYAGMQAALTDEQRRSISATTLAQAYAIARETATVGSYDIGRPRRAGGGAFLLPVTAHTTSFGDVSGTVRLPIVGHGDQARIRWAINETFPGVPAGARLARETTLPPRATLLARDNTVLAHGPDRSSALGSIASSVVGDLGPIPVEQAATFRRAGYPDDARVGVSGLERIFERRLAGTPGGRLTAGGRVLASRAPRAASPVRTTISPVVQQAAVTALAGRLGGVVAMKPRTGEILAAAGIAFSGLQPPGSTFKMVTVTGVLQNGLATPRSTFPYATAATLSGVTLGNANGESCGGTLLQAFAISCNSVFAPLGARLGAHRLVAVAQRFGFNRPSPIPGVATSAIPPAAEIGDDLAVGSSAIGQGRVLATTLQMTAVAATIGLGGRLPVPTLAYRSGQPERVGARVTTAKVAREVRRMMVEVVRRGTGVRAAIPGVTVAGKTGTAELRTTQSCTPNTSAPESCVNQTTNTPSTTDTDAWFASFAPARAPKVAVGVLLVEDGAGGDTAAPAARIVLEEALHHS
jgi:peptidoglycan glycosyltransferase